MDISNQHFSSFKKYGFETTELKRLKSVSHLDLEMATYLDDGNSLIALSTTPNWKLLGGTRLIAEPNGNKDKDWVIRSVIT